MGQPEKPGMCPRGVRGFDWLRALRKVLRFKATRAQRPSQALILPQSVMGRRVKSGLRSFFVLNTMSSVDGSSWRRWELNGEENRRLSMRLAKTGTYALTASGLTGARELLPEAFTALLGRLGRFVTGARRAIQDGETAKAELLMVKMERMVRGWKGRERPGTE